MARHASSCRKSPSTSNMFGIFGGEKCFYLTRSCVHVARPCRRNTETQCHSKNLYRLFPGSSSFKASKQKYPYWPTIESSWWRFQSLNKLVQTENVMGVSDHVLLASSATCQGPVADYVHVCDACSVVQDTDGYCSIVYIYCIFYIYIVYIVSIG